MTILLAIITGGILGYLIERGDLCFHSTLRGPFRRPPQWALLRAYLLILLIATPLIWLMRWFGWINPWVPPFVWQANLIGGFIFGIGMVVAATCITGLFYKLGHGMLGTLIGLATWALGDIIAYRGVLSSFREQLNATQFSIDGQSATLFNIAGYSGVIVTGLIAVLIVIWLVRSPIKSRTPYWSWPRLGLAVGAFTAIAWLLARLGGANYTFGTSGVPTTVYTALLGQDGFGNLWIPVTLISILPGAFLAARFSGTLWIRGETLKRYIQLAAGGLLMGVGAGIAGGCNLGHGLVGVPLLSLGSITTVIAMVAGVWVAHQAGELFGTGVVNVTGDQVHPVA